MALPKVGYLLKKKVGKNINPKMPNLLPITVTYRGHTLLG